jgi:hypothetical protein
MHLTKRFAVLASVAGALAVAVPIASASVPPTLGAYPGAPPALGAYPGFTYPGFSLPDFSSWPVSAWGPTWTPPVGATLYSHGPTVVNDVFNGATVVQVSNGPSNSSVGVSP